MTRSEDRFRTGDLAGALEALQAEIRQNAADPKPRVFLAQLLMVMGQWQRALTQLSVVAELDAAAIPMAHAYRAAIQCEILRAAVFAGERSPLLFGDPEPWLAAMMRAFALDASNPAQAAAMRSEALESAPASGGLIDERPFEWLADADPRLGPILEVLLNGAYYGVPMQRIRAIRIEKPADARDLVWIPATFTWTNEGEAQGFIPVRYPGSEISENAQVRLSRATVWEERVPDVAFPLGQRLLTTDAEEVGLLEVRSILFGDHG
jgi:type VI secretion system protein ImpE